VALRGLSQSSVRVPTQAPENAFTSEKLSENGNVLVRPFQHGPKKVFSQRLVGIEADMVDECAFDRGARDRQFPREPWFPPDWLFLPAV
jgi:hypothetical protein